MRLRGSQLALGVAAVFVAIGLALPWVFYGYSLSFVEGRPRVPVVPAPSEAVGQVWAIREGSLKQEDLAAISPYWFYKWSWCASELAGCDRDSAYRGVSAMASFVALWYLHDGHFTGKGMAWWHIAHASLTVWIQRHMTPQELVTSYLETQHRITERSSGRASPAADRNVSHTNLLTTRKPPHFSRIIWPLIACVLTVSC
jgi:hypothetical protein